MTDYGWPALLNLEQAARYCGMSPDSFEACVEKKRFPPPVDLPIRRKLWQREGLDAAISKGTTPIDDAEIREAEWRKRRENRSAGPRGRVNSGVPVHKAG